MHFNNSTAIAPEVPVHNCPLHCTSTAQTNKESITITHVGVHPCHLDVLKLSYLLQKLLLSTLGCIVLRKRSYLLYYLQENQHLLFKDHIFEAPHPSLLLSSEIFLSKSVFTESECFCLSSIIISFDRSSLCHGVLSYYFSIYASLQSLV